MRSKTPSFSQGINYRSILCRIGRIFISYKGESVEITMNEKTYFPLNRHFGIEDGKDSQIVQVPVRIGVDTIPNELEYYLCATVK